VRYDEDREPQGAKGMATSTPPSGSSNGKPQSVGAETTSWDVELLRVLVNRKGSQVEAQWAIHPQLKQDLLPHEWQEVTDLMTKVSAIVGSRFSQVLSQADPEPSSNA
jgi:hypothetical protein